MNWIERMYDLKGKDPYSQNGEGIYLEYVFQSINRVRWGEFDRLIDIGAGDGFHLSNSRHLFNLGWKGSRVDKLYGAFVSLENIMVDYYNHPFDLVSIGSGGNDYWILNKILSSGMSNPQVIIAEFNPAFTDSRTIKYNPDHEWAGDDYYGFSFEAGKKLAEKHGYEIIFNVANMNLIMVRKDLITVPVPEVTYKQDNFFKASNREDWEWI